MDWDEGPAIAGGPEKGDYGPYRQSERKDMYLRETNRLLEEDKAYKCFCSPQELAERRKTAAGGAFGYDNRCRNLTEADRKKFEIDGKPFSLRFRVPDEQVVTFESLALFGQPVRVHGVYALSSTPEVVDEKS